MQNKFKKFLQKYDSLASIDGILCGILIFALLRPPWGYIAFFTLLTATIIIFGITTLSHKDKTKKITYITNYIRSLMLILYIVLILHIIILLINSS